MRDDCPTCDGTGELTIDIARWNGEHDQEVITCPDCSEDCDPPEVIEVEDEERGAECGTEASA